MKRNGFQIVVTTDLHELNTLCSVLARHYLHEMKELRRIQKREAAGKGTRVRSSEQAFYIADIKQLFDRLLKQRNEFEALRVKGDGAKWKPINVKKEESHG